MGRRTGRGLIRIAAKARLRLLLSPRGFYGAGHFKRTERFEQACSCHRLFHLFMASRAVSPASLHVRD